MRSYHDSFCDFAAAIASRQQSRQVSDGLIRSRGEMSSSIEKFGINFVPVVLRIVCVASRRCYNFKVFFTEKEGLRGRGKEN